MFRSSPTAASAQSGDITKAIAAGASTVMLGSLFAGLKESPGQLVIYKGTAVQGISGNGFARRDGQRFGRPIWPGKLPHEMTNSSPKASKAECHIAARLSDFVYQLVGGLRAGMGYCGTRNIEELANQSANSVRVSTASVSESHPHDIQITKKRQTTRH